MTRAPVRPRLAFTLAGLVLALLGAVLLACGEDDDEVVFMAGFRPQANLPFVAVYVAQKRGFFEEEGLAVRIEHSPGGAEHVQMLEDGEVHFTTATASGLIALRGEREARERELDVVAVALFGQRGDRGYVVTRGAGVDSPRDFAGRVVGTTSQAVAPELRAMLAGAGLSEEDITLERVGFNDLDRFLVGELDIYPVFINNEPDILRRQGHDITVIDPADFGVPTLGLTMVTRRSLLEEDPDLVERFMRATLRGALYAAGHIDEAIDVTLLYAEGADPDHQSFLLETDLAAAARDDGMGRGSPEQWQAVIDLLEEYGSLAAPVEVADVFDGSIVDALYERGELG